MDTNEDSQASEVQPEILAAGNGSSADAPARALASLAMSAFPIVGIGAAAGDIRSLQTFFEGMPSDSGFAFVVIMHMSPDHESNLAQVLQLHTMMPVTQVTASVHVEPDHVYVIPSHRHLVIHDSVISLTEPQQGPGVRVAVDLFFRTLAAAYGQRAVAIVLSGIDSDGVIGIKHIKELGGITIAQDPIEAELDGMPRGAIETGMVDWILTAAQMPPRLMDFIKNERRIHSLPGEPFSAASLEAENDDDAALTGRQIPTVGDEAVLLELLRFLQGQTGHDFSCYKRATVLRRVARRLQVNLLEDMSSYLSFIRAHSAEVTALLRDLLISVTNFFRDSEAFAALESHIPQLFAGKEPGDQVRVWVVGCATGEEAYSVAMLLSERASQLDTPPSIKVLATDLDENAIQFARSGLYPATIEADVSQKRLRSFFQREQGRYRIKKELRELVLFSSHDVLKAPPFSRLDLLTCRNLLIYLKREAQEKVFDTIHFALRPGGLLFLGGSESIDDTHALFAPLDKRYRLYVRRAVSRPGWQLTSLPLPYTLQRVPGMPILPIPSSAPALTKPVDQAASSDLSTFLATPSSERRALLFGGLHLTLLEQYAPPSLIINENQDIVHLSEHVNQFLQFTGGEPSMNLLSAVHPSLRIDLRTALFRASRSQTDITASNVRMSLDGAVLFVNIHVHPIRDSNALQGYTLVVFERAADEAVVPNAAPPTESVALHLEDEIRHLEEQLSAMAEQYDAATEGLKASNKELQAINEELRSATEELETSKEELQSINEELTTVNHELKSNVEELSPVNSDLQNLMAATEIGTIFLDRQLRIKRFTPYVQELFNVIATDIGRPLSDITHKLSYNSLIEDAKRVLRTLNRSEREVSSNGYWFLARLLPYRTLEDRIDGVVLTFVDITSRKQQEERSIVQEREVAALAERNRVAQELHDTLAQGFTGIKLQIDAAEATLREAPDEALYHIVRARDIALFSLQEARRSVRGLRSLFVEMGNLVSAFQNLVAQATNGIEVRFIADGAPIALAADVESDLYRIGQEALTNALRHAQARQITLHLSYTPSQVSLLIHDDGKGYSPNTYSEGLGLRGIRERAFRLNADLRIKSLPGQGTEIALIMNIPPVQNSIEPS